MNRSVGGFVVKGDGCQKDGDQVSDRNDPNPGWAANPWKGGYAGYDGMGELPGVSGSPWVGMGSGYGQSVSYGPSGVEAATVPSGSLQKVYVAWRDLPSAERPPPTGKVVAGHAGKTAVHQLNVGMLRGFEAAHGIPPNTLTPTRTSDGHVVGVEVSEWRPETYAGATTHTPALNPDTPQKGSMQKPQGSAESAGISGVPGPATSGQVHGYGYQLLTGQDLVAASDRFLNNDSGMHDSPSPPQGQQTGYWSQTPNPIGHEVPTPDGPMAPAWNTAYAVYPTQVAGPGAPGAVPYTGSGSRGDRSASHSPPFPDGKRQKVRRC